MRVVFTGGGTGGHVYPALALARHIRKQDPEAEIIFLGTERGLESRILPQEGFRLKVLPVKTPVRRPSRAMVYSLAAMAGSTLQAVRFLRWFSPHVVVGTGGYVSVPAVLAAMFLRIPAVLHEQNVIPGLANRKLSSRASLTCLSFPESEGYFPSRARVKVTGNPRASEAAAPRVGAREYQALGLDPGKKTILVAGGSQGALKLNRVFLKALGYMEGRTDLQVLYITGTRYYEEMRDKARDPGRGPLVRMVPYLDDMPMALGTAHVMISRAGATTLAEINALGIPAILIPSPNVANDHQQANAMVQMERGAALVFREDQMDPGSLARSVLGILDNPDKLASMREASSSLGYPRAAAAMYEALRELGTTSR